MFRNSRIGSIEYINRLLDHGLLLGLAGQAAGGGADDHGLGTKDSPTFSGLTVDNLNLNLNTIQATSGNINLVSGDDIILDSDGDILLDSDSDVILDSGDDIILQAGGSGGDVVKIQPGGDTDDYLEISTVSSKTEIKFVGQNGLITADNGMISFDNENLTTTGNVGIGRIPTAELDILGISQPTILLESSDASDPRICLKTTNTAHEICIDLDESATNDNLSIDGQTASVDTQVLIHAQDGERARLLLYSGTSNFGYLHYGAADTLVLANTKEDEDLVFSVDDGGVTKTITWDADVDKLKHSAGTFDFDDDNIITTGTIDTGVATVDGLILGDNQYAEFGVGGLTGALGSDGRIYSDGTNLIVQVESPTGANANFTNPSLTFDYVDFIPGLDAFVVKIGAPRSAPGNVIVFDRSLYAYNASLPGFIATAHGGDITKYAVMSYTDATNTGTLSMVPGTDDFKIQSMANFLIAPTTATQIGNVGTDDVVVEADGDTYFRGGAGLPFGSFWGNEIAFVSAGGTGTYFEISDADITVGQTHNTTFQNNKELAVTYEGMYKVDWSMSVKATGANKHIVGGIGVDVGGAGALTIQNDGRNHAVSTGNAEFAISGTAILDLSASSEVGLMATNETDNTNVTIEHVCMSIVQIGGT